MPGPSDYGPVRISIFLPRGLEKSVASWPSASSAASAPDRAPRTAVFGGVDPQLKSSKPKAERELSVSAPPDRYSRRGRTAGAAVCEDLAIGSTRRVDFGP